MAKNINELTQNIEKILQDKNIMAELSKPAVDILNNNIEKMLYEGDFQPNIYERRYKNGGYGDPNNIKIDFINDNKIEITNETLANGEEKGERLDKIIEFGEDYNWNRQPPPRPIFKATKEELIKTRILKKRLKEILESKGLKVK